MSKVTITEQYLTDIANAIRQKTGLSNTYFPSEMANAILSISGGGGITPVGTLSITANGTYNVTQYASAEVDVPVGSTINNQNKTVTPTESSQSVTYDSGYTGLGTVTVGAISNTYVGSAIDVNPTPTVSGATVTIPAGYYNAQTTKSVTTTVHADPSVSIDSTTGLITVSHTQTAGYVSADTATNTLQLTTQAAKTITPSSSSQTAVAAGRYTLGAVTVTAVPTETKTVTVNGDVTPSTGKFLSKVTVNVPTGSTINNQNKTVDPSTSQQTVTADSGYTGLGTVTVNAMPTGTAGTPSASKGTVSNYTISITPSVTNITGYIAGSTKTGTAVTVSASELVSGTYTVDSSGTKDVTNYASASVPAGTAGTPSASKGAVSNHSISVTPSVTNTTGWITGSTKTGTAVTVTASELVSGSDTVTTNDTYDVTNLAELIVNVSGGGGGGVTVTDEANATGTTCVITSGGSPTPSGIPLNTELIDFTKLTEDYGINSSGEAVAAQWYCVSDYTAVDPSMTFSYTGCRWYYIGVYDSSKEVLRTIYIYNDGTADPDNSNLANGTLSDSELTGASYVRITGIAVQSQYRLSLIRTA